MKKLTDKVAKLDSFNSNESKDWARGFDECQRQVLDIIELSKPTIADSEILYLVFDYEEGILCVGEKEEAEKVYNRVVGVNQILVNGEVLSDDDMGYKVIMAKIEKGYLLEMGKTEWKEIFIDTEEN